jgi:hypothetical protein
LKNYSKYLEKQRIFFFTQKLKNHSLDLEDDGGKYFLENNNRKIPNSTIPSIIATAIHLRVVAMEAIRVRTFEGSGKIFNRRNTNRFSMKSKEATKKGRKTTRFIPISLYSNPEKKTLYTIK